MLKRSLAAMAAVLALGPFAAHGSTLYAASLRSGGSNAGDITIAGNLYTINLSNGNAKLVGSFRLPGSRPIGVTGMAAHPKSGVLYGITAEQSPNSPNALVTIDPATGGSTLVGELGVAVSDIAFDSHGTLWVWLPATSRLGSVNLSTAAVQPLGRAGPPGTPAGIAIDQQDMVFVTAKGAGGTLDNVDMVTGNLQIGPALTGAPFSTQIASLSFSPSGLLLGVNSNGGSPALTRLVTINTATGAVATIGPLPDDTDALAFVGSGTGLAPTFLTINPGLRVVIVVLSIVLVSLAVMLLLRRRK